MHVKYDALCTCVVASIAVLCVYLSLAILLFYPHRAAGKIRPIGVGEGGGGGGGGQGGQIPPYFLVWHVAHGQA